MDNTKLDSIADKLISLLSMLYVKIIRMVREESSENPYSSHYRVLGMLMQNDALPMSEIGKCLCISRPNMTVLIDRLIDEGMVHRLPDKNDRRVINITITDKGKSFMEESIAIVKGKIKRSLSHLDDKEINTLYNSLENMERIFSRIGKEESN